MYRGDPLIVCVSSSLCKYLAKPKSVQKIQALLNHKVYYSKSIFTAKQNNSFVFLYISPKSRNFTDFRKEGGWVGAPHNTNICKIFLPCRATCTSCFFYKKSLSNLAILLLFRPSIQCCHRIFTNWSMPKVEKNCGRICEWSMRRNFAL